VLTVHLRDKRSSVFRN